MEDTTTRGQLVRCYGFYKTGTSRVRYSPCWRAAFGRLHAQRVEEALSPRKTSWVGRIEDATTRVHSMRYYDFYKTGMSRVRYSPCWRATSGGRHAQRMAGELSLRKILHVRYMEPWRLPLRGGAS